MLTQRAPTDAHAGGHSRRRRRTSPTRRAISGLGRLFIAAGLTVLLFTAYQLWGTGLREAASQRELQTRFEHQRDTSSAPSQAAEADRNDDAGGRRPEASTEGQAREPQSAPPPSIGDPVAIMRIPKLGLERVVVEGADVGSLRKGPGHEPGTALPGMAGNAVIAGHRTTYGAPFYRLDELAPDDLILIETPSGPARYVVTGSQVVDPDDVWILEPTGDDRLTLYTCTPRYSAESRLVVTAHLTGALPSTPPPDAAQGNASRSGTSAPQPPPLVGELAAPTGSLSAAAGWGVSTAIAAAGIWWAGRRYRRLVAYPLGAPVLAVVLFGTFERVAALLPGAL